MSVIRAQIHSVLTLQAIPIVEETTQTQLIMTAEELMSLKALGGGTMTPFEQMTIGYRQNKSHTSGVGVAGLVLGTVGTAAAVGAWIFAPLFASAKSSQAREVAKSAKELSAAQYAAALQLMNQQGANMNTALERLIGTVAAERAERIAGDVTLSQTVTDTVSGSQQGTLTAQQAAELAASQATQQVMQQTFADAVTGRSSLNATPVQIYSAPQPCGCPGGCGCNGGY